MAVLKLRQPPPSASAALGEPEHAMSRRTSYGQRIASHGARVPERFRIKAAFWVRLQPKRNNQLLHGR